MTCDKCDGAGILIRSASTLEINERTNTIPLGSSVPRARMQLCSCITEALAALESAARERPAPASEPATGVLGIFEALGELVDDATRPKPKKGTP